jgi:hypothetical protein
MSNAETSSPLTHLMRMSTQALYECQDSISHEKSLPPNTLNGIQAESLLKLMETLVDTKIQMTKEIEAGRISPIDPEIITQMEFAIHKAINKPIDEKVNQIYFSIFGYNSALWQVLKEMHKLLKTIEILNQKSGKKVAKVEKPKIVRRKKRHEKDVLNQGNEEN